MSTPVRVTGCGSVVRVDTGDGSGFVTQGLTDSFTPWNQSKIILDTPTLDCTTSSEVGREEQSQITWMQYWDPQDSDQLKIVTSFEDSISDTTKLDVDIQAITPSYLTTGGGSAKTVTYEATCQIASISPAEVTPDGHWKRTVVAVRKSAITRTVA